MTATPSRLPETAFGPARRVRRGLWFALALPVLAAAAPGAPRPGLWIVSLDSRAAAAQPMPGKPGEKPVCLTEEDLEQPEQMLVGSGILASSVCEVTRREPGPGRVRFDMACSGGLGITGTGEVQLAERSLDGTLDVRFAAAPKKAMQSRLHAEYQGECPGEEGGFELNFP
jgi:hypothetical protein